MTLQALRPATEAYLELSRTCKMEEIFVKIFNGFYLLFLQKSAIVVAWLSSKYVSLQH